MPSNDSDLAEQTRLRKRQPTRAAGGPVRILVAGLGNVLLRDDGVGVHAVRLLHKAPPPGALVVDVGTAVLDALHLLEAADYVLALDAMQAGGPPGTVYACGIGDLAAGERQLSLHEVNLLAALRFLPSTRPPPHITILGVEPAVIDFGLELSPPVQAALPALTSEVRRRVARWREAAAPPAVASPSAARLPNMQ